MSEQTLGVHSETGTLRQVIICRPGLAHRRLTPSNCDALLFDDVFWVKQAQKDHDAFGEAMRNNGRFNGQQIVPEAVVADIRAGGDAAKFADAGYATLPGWSYRNMWWVAGEEQGMFAARGIHGQTIYVDPKAEMVIARFASNPVAANGANDPVSLPAYAALAKYLNAR